MSRPHGAGAASVVTELRAFLREPALRRAHYTYRRGVLEGGHHVFRFAQGRFPQGLLHDASTAERDELRRAAEAFIREVCFWEGATHYQTLCVPSDAPREAVKESYHLAMALLHPDRSEQSAVAWPAAWAQRANRAYEVLSDSSKRAAYDATLRMLEGATAFASPGAAPRTRRRPGERISPARVRMAKALVALSAVAATLLLLEVWLGETGDEYALLPGLSRTRLAARPGSDAPRISTAPIASRVSHEEPGTGDRFSLRPWWGASGAPAVAQPRTPAPREETKHAAAPPAVVARARSIATPGEAAQKVAVVAQTSAPSLVAPALPASLPAEAPLAPLPASQDIELLVARLIGYYEAGEADNLMSLIDTDGGFWRNARIRQPYAEFFRATRQRRLRVESLNWSNASGMTQARGEATVQAEYFDSPGTLERRVEVEMDIALRDGRARITRLSLFPGTR
jgi:curved DNA-binding protein CbpA